MARMLWCLVGLLCLAGAANAMGSAGFDMSWDVMSGGGGAVSSSSFSMGGTAGQITGTSASANYQLQAGFWVPDTSGPVPEKGRLSVNSTPEGAEIFLDGADYRHVTNATLDLLPGTVNVGVEKKCYLIPETIEVRVEEGKTARAEFVLTPDPACSAVPEFPSPVVPASALMGLLGAVFLVRRMKA